MLSSREKGRVGSWWKTCLCARAGVEDFEDLVWDWDLEIPVGCAPLPEGLDLLEDCEPSPWRLFLPILWLRRWSEAGASFGGSSFPFRW